MRKVLVFLFLFAAFSETFAQFTEIGAGVGVLNYKGDVTPRFKPFAVRPGANIFLRYNYSRAVSFKVGGMIGSIYGNDKDSDDPLQQARGYSFTSDIMEAYSQVEYNFLNFRTNQSRIVAEWTPYLFAGGAFATAKTSNQNSVTGGGNTYSKTIFTIPFGIGFKKKWNPNWNWGIEFGTRKTFTQYLDNLPGLNFDPNDPQNPKPPASTDPGYANYLKNAKLLQGNRPLNDMYYYTNFSVSYVFYSVRCPNPRR